MQACGGDSTEKILEVLQANVKSLHLVRDATFRRHPILNVQLTKEMYNEASKEP